MTNEVCTKENTTISSRIIKNNQEVLTQFNHTRLKTTDDDIEPGKPKITKTVKTYQKKVIRKYGPDGKVIEESFVEGDPIEESNFGTTVPTSTNTDICPSEICGESKIEASYGCTIISETGEKNVSRYTTGPIQVPISSENVQNVYPVGATVKKVFRSDKTESTTHSSIRNGEERVLFSKSEFQSISGESNLKVKPIANTEPESVNGDSIVTDPITSKEAHPNQTENIQVKNDENNDEPAKNIDVSTANENPTSRNTELSKILDFSTLDKNINILDRQLIREGEVKAIDEIQTFPKTWRKMIKKGEIEFQLIVFNDLVVIARKLSATNFVVIEYCERSETNATTYCPDTPANNSKPKRKGSKSKLFSCVSSKQPPSKFDPEHLFVLQVPKSNPSLITEPLILRVSNTESRDQWIGAVNKSS